MQFKANQHGFTVIEFMIATTVFVVVIAAGSSFFGNFNRAAIVNEEMVDMQQDIRIAMVTLTRDIALAGYQTTAFGACGNALTPVNANNGPDTISIVTMGNIVSSLTATALPGAAQLTIGPAAGVPPVGQISLNGITSTNAVINAGNVVNINPPLAGSGETYPIGTQILTPTCIQYAVDPVTRQLTRTVNGVANLLASGVLDMQFAYALDVNEDNLIDDANGSGVFDAGDFVNAPGNPADIRLVRVSLFIQTSRSDANFINGTPMTLEDHDPTTVPGYSIANYQAFRSRVLTRIVRPRNVGLPS